MVGIVDLAVYATNLIIMHLEMLAKIIAAFQPHS